MTFHQNNNSIQTCDSGISGCRESTDNERFKKIETDNFNLRRENEKHIATINLLKQSYTKQQKELEETKVKIKELEKTSTVQAKKLHESQWLFVNACKKRDPDVLYKKVKEINKKLHATEENLNSQKNENQELKRKLSVDQTAYEEIIQKKRQKLSENRSEIHQLKKDLINEQKKFTSQATELASVREMLKTTKETVTELEAQRDSQISLINKQSEYIRNLESQASLLQPALEEKQRLQQELDEALQNTHDLELKIKDFNSKESKIRSENQKLSVLLKQTQIELDGNLHERNQLFKFAQDVGVLIQFPLNSSSRLKTQLPEVLAHLKETLSIRGIIFQHQERKINMEPPTPCHISIPPSAYSPQQQLCKKEDGGDQLYDAFSSSSMMNISFPLQFPSSSIQSPTTINSKISVHTIQTVSTLPQSVTGPAETTAANSGNIQDTLFQELMNDAQRPVTPKLRTNTKKAKSGPPSSRAKQIVIMKPKKHEEDVSQRKKGSGENCEGGSKYVCVCGTVETSLDRLNIHIEQFNQEKKFKCDKCPRRFLLLGQLRQHLIRTHGIPHPLDNIVRGCRTCGKMFETREQQRQHVKNYNNSTSTNSVVENGNDTRSTSCDIEIVKQPVRIVAAAPEQIRPPEPRHVSRRVPSISTATDPEDEEVDVEM